MNWLWIGVIGIYVNLTVFLFTDFSLLYFFGLVIGLGFFIWKMTSQTKRK